MTKRIPTYITTRQNLTRMVLWTALYAWLFISIYQPFNSRQWIAGVSELTYFTFGTLAVLVAMLVIAVSRVGMCYYSKKHQLTYIEFGYWVGAEILAMSLVYALFPMLILDDVTDRFLSLWGDAIIYTSFVLLIPYAIIMLAIILQHYRRIVEEMGLAGTDGVEALQQPDMYNFYDDRNELKLSLRPETLYYIEAADNYVIIYYQGQGKLQRYMLRNTLRGIEERGQQGLLRTHRSFIVNFAQVKLIKRTAEGMMIELNKDGLPNIPVSKTYLDTTLNNIRQ